MNSTYPFLLQRESESGGFATINCVPTWRITSLASVSLSSLKSNVSASDLFCSGVSIRNGVGCGPIRHAQSHQLIVAGNPVINCRLGNAHRIAYLPRTHEVASLHALVNPLRAKPQYRRHLFDGEMFL
jgi:hypothetical protein